MSASDLPSPARVLVFAPYLEEDGALLSPHYDPPEYRAEIGSWLEAMGMDWEWVPAASRVNIRPVLRLSDRDHVSIGTPDHGVVLAIEMCGPACGCQRVAVWAMAARQHQRQPVTSLREGARGWTLWTPPRRICRLRDVG